MLLFFFFKQKTAYEMRISDWSSDVCSSDLLAARHIIGLRRRVDDVVDRLHREVEGHEFDDRPQPAHRGAGAEARKAIFGDRRINDALRSKFVEQTLGDLVGALIFGNLFAHHADARSEEHTSEIQSLMRIQYAVFCMDKKK